MRLIFDTIFLKSVTFKVFLLTLAQIVGGHYTSGDCSLKNFIKISYCEKVWMRRCKINEVLVSYKSNQILARVNFIVVWERAGVKTSPAGRHRLKTPRGFKSRSMIRKFKLTPNRLQLAARQPAQNLILKFWKIINCHFRGRGRSISEKMLWSERANFRLLFVCN